MRTIHISDLGGLRRFVELAAAGHPDDVPVLNGSGPHVKGLMLGIGPVRDEPAWFVDAFSADPELTPPGESPRETFIVAGRPSAPPRPVNLDHLRTVTEFADESIRSDLAEFLEEFAGGCPPGALAVLNAMLNRKEGVENPSVQELFAMEHPEVAVDLAVERVMEALDGVLAVIKPKSA